MEDNFVIGVDFGTDSVRAIVVDSRNGEVIGADVGHYPRWMDGQYCQPADNQFRQHPLDYLDGLASCVKGAIVKAGRTVGQSVRGLAIDTTGSTPVR